MHFWQRKTSIPHDWTPTPSPSGCGVIVFPHDVQLTGHEMRTFEKSSLVNVSTTKGPSPHFMPRLIGMAPRDKR
jgi:hypothetical protein